MALQRAAEELGTSHPSIQARHAPSTASPAPHEAARAMRWLSLL
jgi:hypothetical protein